EATVDPRLLRDRDLHALDLRRLFLRGGKALRRGLLELGATFLEQLDVLRRGALRLPLRDEVISRVALLDLHDLAQVADVDDLFEQNDLHRDLSRQCRSVYGTSARKRARLIAIPSWRW